MIVITGVVTAIQGHFPLPRTGWILWTLVLFTISGLAFMFSVVPLQRQLRDLAQAGEQSGTFEYAQYHALALMVLKPGQ